MTVILLVPQVTLVVTHVGTHVLAELLGAAVRLWWCGCKYDHFDFPSNPPKIWPGGRLAGHRHIGEKAKEKEVNK